MLKLHHNGNPNIGAFGITNNKISFVSPDSKKLISAIKNELKTEVIPTTIFNSNIIGIYCSMNSDFIIVPNLIEKEELEKINEHIEVIIMDTRENAWGNLIALNDNGVIASPLLKKDVIKKLEDSLGLEVLSLSIANYKTVGSLIYPTNKGGLITYKASPEEIEGIENVLKVKLTTASINFGSPFVSLGVIANDKGYVVGETSTGIEIARVEEGLDLIN